MWEWRAGLAFTVLIEKLAPWGAGFGRMLACIMVGGGVWLLLQGAA